MEIGTAEMFCNTISFNWTKINLFPWDRPKGIKMNIASETNVYGTLLSDTFVEGNIVDFHWSNDIGLKEITMMSLNQKNNQYLPETSNCTEISFYQCMADKVFGVITHEDCPKKCIPPFYQSILNLATNKTQFDLCKDHQSNKCLGEKITQRLQEELRLEDCHRSCIQIDYFAKVKNTNSLRRFWPEYMSKEICYRFETTVVTIEEEYLIFGFPDMIGSVGGSLGLFLGFSFFDQINSVIEMIHQKIQMASGTI